jgi:hypothetical protein
VAAEQIQLSPGQIDRLSNVTPAAGDYLNEQGMLMVER